MIDGSGACFRVAVTPMSFLIPFSIPQAVHEFPCQAATTEQCCFRLRVHYAVAFWLGTLGPLAPYLTRVKCTQVGQLSAALHSVESANNLVGLKLSQLEVRTTDSQLRSFATQV